MSNVELTEAAPVLSAKRPATEGSKVEHQVGGGMSKTELFIILSAICWLCGVFFGMGIEQKLLELWRRKHQSQNGKDGCPYPLPMSDIELSDRADDSCQKWTFVLPKNENEIAVGVVVGRNVPPLIPRRDSLSEARRDSHPATPNV